VLRAAGESETTQENIRDWLGLDERDPGVQFLRNEEIAAIIFFCVFSSALRILSNFPIVFISLFFIF
jgi:hypothetical protein